MSVKDVVAKTWALARNFDGLCNPKWPLGDKPAGFVTIPYLLDTDIVSGSLINNYNGKGAFISLFGYSFGNKTALGTSRGARVYFRDASGDNVWHEVDNYRFLEKSRNFVRNQVQHLRCQIGALGGSQVAGRALDVKVIVNGVDSNILSRHFINQPGRFFYVSLAGDDATGVPDDITHPFRYVQHWTGSTFTGIFAVGVLKPGDTIIPRGGDWTDTVGYDHRWCRFATGSGFNSGGGSAPTGVIGHGYIHFTAYPTLFGDEDVHHASAYGGIHGCEGTFAASGYGRYISMSSIHCETTSAGVRDAGPVNMQSGANHWRIVNMECGPWPTSLTTTNSSGIGGEGSDTIVAFNYIHGMSGNLTDLQNHGMYFGGQEGGGYDSACKRVTVKYNWIKDSLAGSGIQFYWQGSIDTSVFTDIKIHNNFIEGTKKYGINLGQSMVSASVFNNIVINSGRNALRFEGLHYGSGVNPLNINVLFNTFHNWNTDVVLNDAAITNDGYADTGSINIYHNIFSAKAGRPAPGAWYENSVFTGADSKIFMRKNVWYDPDGDLTTAPSQDAEAITGDPKFSNIAKFDFTCLSGGSGIDAATPPEALTGDDEVLFDFYGIARPQGSYKDIGACEGIGT